MFLFEPELYLSVDDPFQALLLAMSGESSGAPVAPFSPLQNNIDASSGDLVDDLFMVPDFNTLPPIPSELESQLGSQNEADSPQRKWKDSNKVVQDVMGGIYSSAPSVFLPETLTVQEGYSPPSTSGETEQPTPEYNTEVGSSSSRNISPFQPSLLHPSLRRPAPPVAASPESSEESSELELNSRKRKRSTAANSKEPLAKRAKLRRETKTSAKKKIKKRAEKSPPLPKEKYVYPTADELPPPRKLHLAETLPVVPARTPSPKGNPGPSNKPGYPYWGAEHSPNPPKYVSTPVDRREEGLYNLMDPPPGERPGYSYVTLIRAAILGSKDKKLTIEGIYEQIMGRFEYYRDQNGKCDKGWKNSVRHQMSLSACFEKKEKLLWESGKGVWWTVNESVEGGTKRERKRKPRGKAAKEAVQAQQENNIVPPRALTLTSHIQMQKRRVDHPLFPQALPAHLISQRPPSTQTLASQARPRQQNLGPEPSQGQRPAPSTPFASTVPTQALPPIGPVSIPGMGNSHPSVQAAFRPATTTTASSSANLFRPTANSAISLLHASGSTLNRAPASPAPPRMPFVGSRNSQTTSNVRGVIHTRWEGSADFQFAMPRDARGRDSTDSSEEDD